jgi:alpha-beta hydrolase superfamily lysophospholipase
MIAVPGRSLRIAAAAVLVALAVVVVWPVRTGDLVSRPHPARDYVEALALIDVLEHADGSDVQPECRTLLLGHGHRTARATVLLHGLTNCPKQFEALGRELWADGQNVLIVRLPHHGLEDRMTPDLGRLTAGELTHTADLAVDIADGLGERVTVSGLSIGAVAAAWTAAERRDVDRAVIIAPLLGVATVPRVLTHALANLWLLTPNRFHWWDPRQGRRLAGPPQVYPRFSTRALGEALRLAAAVEAHARERAPRAGRIVLVRVGGDRAVNNAAIVALAGAWRARGAPVEEYEFPIRLGLNHDVIDPEQSGARVGVVYPVLIKWLR